MRHIKHCVELRSQTLPHLARSGEVGENRFANAKLDGAELIEFPTHSNLMADSTLKARATNGVILICSGHFLPRTQGQQKAGQVLGLDH